MVSNKKKVVVLTGAGVSAESGIPTFRDANGLWEGHDVTEVASPEGFKKNPALVLEFYNQRRKVAHQAKPNAGHQAIAALEEHFDVTVITQNIDNLHEQAGSTHVLHLHGELFKSRSTLDPTLVYNMDGWELNVGDKCERGAQLRPHIVWFGEPVPMMEPASIETYRADVFIVVGTSMQVYPAAGLIDLVRPNTPIYIVDPKRPPVQPQPAITFIEAGGGQGMQQVQKLLLQHHL